MKTLKHLVIFLFINLLIAIPSILAQFEFVQFTRYDQLHWSPDGKAIGFRCILLDEAQPEKIKKNILIKNLVSDQLFCINPTPERFVVSKNSKFLMFSSIYGIYLMRLDSSLHTYQLLFQDPTDQWSLNEFGFYDNENQFYIQRLDYQTSETIKEYFEFNLPQKLSDQIELIPIQKIPNVSGKPSYNLKTVEASGDQSLEFVFKNKIIRFSPTSDPTKPENFNLILLSKNRSKILIPDCRPRLLSLSPDSLSGVICVFRDGNHYTYFWDHKKGNLSLIEEKKYYSISWLNNEKYICLTEDGLFLRTTYLTKNQKLDQWYIPEWCSSIQPDFPQYELQVGFVEDAREAEAEIVRLQQSGFIARKIYYQLRSKSGYRIRVGGYQTRKSAQTAGEKLSQKGFSYWITRIDDFFDYFNRASAPEVSNFGDQSAIIDYKKNNYLRCRILIRSSNQDLKIIVPEMNNIPGREEWRINYPEMQKQ